jgi:hypothetical protein
MDPHGTDGLASPRCFLERDWLLAASPLGSSDIRRKLSTKLARALRRHEEEV